MEHTENSIDAIIAYVTNTNAASWEYPNDVCADYQNPLAVHLEAMSDTATEYFGNNWASLEDAATVIEGYHGGYLLHSPKARVIAFLTALRDGREESAISKQQIAA